MSPETNSLQQIGALLEFLDNKLREGSDTPEQLQELQRQFDAINDVQRQGPDSPEYRRYALELQALIYFAVDKDSEGKELLDQLLRDGGGSALHSSCLRQYVESNAGGGLQSAAGIRADFTQFSDKERMFLDSYLIREGTDIHFFTRKPVVFLLYSLLTGGLYDLYWFNMNWRAVRSVTGQKMRPFWRAIFLVFWAWPLFKIMRLQARARGYGEAFSAGWMAIFYILVSSFGSDSSSTPGQYVSFWIVKACMTIAGVFILINVQKWAVYNNQKVAPGASLNAPYRKIEVVLILLLGIALITSVTAGLMLPKHKQLTPAQQTQAISMKHQIDSLTSQYNTCSSAILQRRDTLNTADQSATEAYNSDVAACEKIRNQHNRLVEQYDNLIGVPVPNE